ncbi:E3 ubiquitin-protein ligase RNF149 [Rousettus aegyptiacus]|uniref:Ring finger protein 149 n=1 Tax=Rousettus aegyptiacus TaxID=9407 RepID=A0A7J8FLV8_ROUAE|nr:E3 ubiquitin-protein ligase RNF149 [Rousettus aegyptiacus]XP_015976262.2 E3 ubiquitin-protein ligase RNF149 [Rousettus aegyptiacus]XP_036080085.1 E3 ubiquitin-protein ligase RNF149 [Rousettus aegyptiacus]XP_036080086.1 E3 ubiquitin-protein ligase RNF149 [Rousettus aegyptiacus]XP_036080087.1 E3 ubiquitin-protein ligase RNF149 [Rousettus aegyptiacus]XP_036080088.1 E3 ubiquitin-protein ligase RNF149 [Rousettus aegyptiacus]KAF6448646.1 ring finger protein 149 [Rousettus aegyptiacus]
MARRRLPEADCGPRGALALLALALCAPGARGRALEWYSAVVTTEYRDPRTNQTVRSVAESGRFGDSSPKESALGLVGVPRAADHDPEGCSPDTRFFVPLPGGGGTAPWVALVARGGCNFKDKVLVAARRNASAVVVYNEERHGNLTAPMSHAGTGSIVVIMVSYPKGKEILDLVQKGISVKMTIEVGARHVQEFISGQSVVFVAIAFITMMIISLAWLIFYYIQRFLYTGSQFGSQSHRKETKKVIGQLPLHTIKHGEKGIDVEAENCAVCIENFKVKDVIRILPCKHIFHRICIDPWLLDHRTCPMCKLDVIKALGYWGELEDVQEMPAPELAPGSVVTADLSITVQEDDRSDRSNSPLSSTNEPGAQCDTSFKEESGENTALLETGRSDLQYGGPVS